MIIQHRTYQYKLKALGAVQNHTHTLPSHSPSSSYMSNEKQLMDELILEYLVVCGLHKQVEIFARESGLNSSSFVPDVTEVRTRSEIVNCISNGDVEMAIALLRDSDPDFLNECVQQHFELRRYQLMQHITSASKDGGEIDESDIRFLIDFVETYLVPLTTSHQDDQELTSQLTQKLQDIMAVLMYPTLEFAGKMRMGNGENRQSLAKEVNCILLARHGLPQGSRMSLIEQASVWIREERMSNGRPKLDSLGNGLASERSESSTLSLGATRGIDRLHRGAYQFNSIIETGNVRFESDNSIRRRTRPDDTLDPPGRRLNVFRGRGPSEFDEY